jgi:hypothetical protein
VPKVSGVEEEGAEGAEGVEEAEGIKRERAVHCPRQTNIIPVSGRKEEAGRSRPLS